jgi:hypothetical protein
MQCNAARRQRGEIAIAIALTLHSPRLTACLRPSVYNYKPLPHNHGHLFMFNTRRTHATCRTIQKFGFGISSTGRVEDLCCGQRAARAEVTVVLACDIVESSEGQNYREEGRIS